MFCDICLYTFVYYFYQFVGSRVFAENLRIKGNLDTRSINHIDIRKRFETAVYTDEDTHIKEVRFENFSGMVYFFNFLFKISKKYG